MPSQTRNDVSSQVTAFIARQRTYIYNEYSRMFADVEKNGLTNVSKRNHLTMNLTDMVTKNAFDEELVVSYSHCVENSGQEYKIMSYVCYGSFCKLKNEEDDEDFRIDDATVRPHWVERLETSVHFTELDTSDGQEMILVKNPLLHPPVASYLRWWSPNIATIHTWISTMSLVAKEAVVEN